MRTAHARLLAVVLASACGSNEPRAQGPTVHDDMTFASLVAQTSPAPWPSASTPSAFDPKAAPKRRSLPPVRRHGAAPDLPLELVHVAKRPHGERAARAERGPTCVGDADRAERVAIRSEGRSLSLRSEGGGNVAVYEGSKRLWVRKVGSADGTDVPKACAADGWGVVLAGDPRHGTDAYDLFTGKLLGPGDVAVFAPDLSFALVPPRFGWSLECYSWSRTFRVTTDGSRKPYALDTIPVPGPWTCESGTPDRERPPNSDAPTVAISGDSTMYAIASAGELALFRAEDDALVATFDRPPYDDYQRRADVNTLSFSQSGSYVVLSRRGTVSPEGEHAAEEHWFRITQRGAAGDASH